MPQRQILLLLLPLFIRKMPPHFHLLPLLYRHSLNGPWASQQKNLSATRCNRCVKQFLKHDKRTSLHAHDHQNKNENNVGIKGSFSLSSYLSRWTTKPHPAQERQSKFLWNLTVSKRYRSHAQKTSMRGLVDFCFILFLNSLIKQDDVKYGRWAKGGIEIIEKSSMLNTQGFHWKTQERHSTTWGMWWAALMTPGEPATRGLKQNLHNSMAKFDIKNEKKTIERSAVLEADSNSNI